MNESLLSAKVREGSGKAIARRIRRDGRVPAVLYGAKDETVSFSLNRRELERMLSGSTSVFTLDLDGKKLDSVIKEIQYHPVKSTVMHIDFQRLQAGTVVTVSIPLRFNGEAPGVKLGGIFQEKRTELSLTCMPRFIPEYIDVDISELELNDSIHISDLKLENIEINEEPEITICTVALPKIVEEVEEEEELLGLEEESAEPEVITAKKEDEAATEEE